MSNLVHVIFREPGQWDKFSMHASFTDAEGFRMVNTYEPADIVSEWAQVFEQVVRAIVAIGANWQATQVWVTKHNKAVAPAEEGGEFTTQPVLVLRIEARNPKGAMRTFSHTDYPQFELSSQEAVNFFDYFTTEQEEAPTE